MVMLLRVFGPYKTIFMAVCCYNRYYGNAVNGFLDKYNNYDCVFTDSNFPVILDGKFVI
jgi:hypothetical protein